MSIKLILTFLFFAAAMVALHLQIDRAYQVDEEDNRKAFFIPDARQVQAIDGGYHKLVADLYWLSFIQYTGDVFTPGGHYSRSYHFLKLITDLDPYFTKPYWFGCWAIGYWQKAPDKADEILKTGIRNNPGVWELPYIAGVNQYLFAKRYKTAAQYYRQAAQDKGAPDWMEREALILESPLPEMIKRSRILYKMYQTAKDPNLKSGLYGELTAFLEQEYRAAPNQRTKQSLALQLKNLKADYQSQTEN